MKRFGITLIAALMLCSTSTFAGQPSPQPRIERLTSTDQPIPASATILSEGMVQLDLPASANETKWYRIDNDTKKKLTIGLTGPTTAGVDYDLRLYHPNTAGTALQQLALSQFKTQSTEQLSYIAEAGTYYVGVTAASGLDTANPFRLVFRSSTSYDVAEPDDSPWQAPKLVLHTPFTLLNQTKDLDDDQDWQKLELGKDTPIIVATHKHDNRTIPYDGTLLHIFNEQFTPIKTIHPFMATPVNLSKGTYYLQFAGGKAGSGYSLRIKELLPPQAARVQIDKIDTEGGVAGFINYGQGNKWRVKGTISINGTAFGTNDQPIANAPVAVDISIKLGNQTITAMASTGANGTFSIPLTLEPAVGNYTFDTTVSRHYYDIVPIRFRSNDKAVSSNINDLYHFAYQIKL
ncbi:pre-peptidase C-terminal domain-containing protein [Chitinivorax sp. B]|uniref:pre-peptidase C-terminal domain-containing protein n=1 Tax=Chitinivorax sp. B TaxID=2502235 RepID=UPI0010F48013|nr:pre-peptidase C-terminal domain-containing protein [Chitinivorax sp. B]